MRAREPNAHYVNAVQAYLSSVDPRQAWHVPQAEQHDWLETMRRYSAIVRAGRAASDLHLDPHTEMAKALDTSEQGGALPHSDVIRHRLAELDLATRVDARVNTQLAAVNAWISDVKITNADVQVQISQYRTPPSSHVGRDEADLDQHQLLFDASNNLTLAVLTRDGVECERSGRQVEPDLIGFTQDGLSRVVETLAQAVAEARKETAELWHVDTVASAAEHRDDIANRTEGIAPGRRPLVGESREDWLADIAAQQAAVKIALTSQEDADRAIDMDDAHRGDGGVTRAIW
ncbi:hypothetical protein FOE78_04600 [Microlunatus elymi]|uniref:Uncharacterized protein n=1 Tax=Microlunatus elymi TaxID=2596828 RepID=A0A516PVT0_9ACTN|nr:hypothetical protein [Microlunatus elymi]QDP95283.1 hypothetical protein FOE78_04600 [Microlunatus elymi]